MFRGPCRFGDVREGGCPREADLDGLRGVREK